jgi:hypothetical protein
VAALYTETESSGILHILQDLDLANRSKEFPPWVSNWTNRPTLQFKYDSYLYRSFAASGQYSYVPKQSNGPNQLVLRGYRIDSITRLGDEPTWPSRGIDKSNIGWMVLDDEQWEMIANGAANDGLYYSTSESIHLAFTRTRLQDSWSSPALRKFDPADSAPTTQWMTIQTRMAAALIRV